MAEVIKVVDILDQSRVKHIYSNGSKPIDEQEAPISSKAIQDALVSSDNAPLTIISMDADTGEDTKSYQNIKKIGIGGSFAVVQEIEDGRVNIFVRQKTDFKHIANADAEREFNLTSRYIWKNGNDEYKLPTGIVSGEKYEMCLQKNNNFLVYKIIGDKGFISGDEYNNIVSYDKANATISFTIIYNDILEKKIECNLTELFGESDDIDGQTIYDTPTETDTSIYIRWSKIHKITSEDASAGKTPGTIEIANLEFGFKTKNANAYLSFSAKINDTTIPGSMSNIIVYDNSIKPVAFTEESIAEATLDNYSTIYISGISYKRSGSIIVKTKDLQNSNYIASTSLNRFKIIAPSGLFPNSAERIYNYDDEESKIKPQKPWDSESLLYVEDIYSFSVPSSANLGYCNNSATFNYFGYNREDEGKTGSISSTVSVLGPFYTKKSQSSSTFEDFILEDYRVDDSLESWHSEEHLRDGNKLPGLFVQNGLLSWPWEKNDTITNSFSGKTVENDEHDIRTYIRKFNNINASQDTVLSKFDITIEGENINLFSDPDIKIYIWPVVGGNIESHAMQVNKQYSGTNALSGYYSETNGIAEGETTGAISCVILNNVMNSLDPKQKDGFWLLIEMHKSNEIKNKKIKKITVKF